MKNLPWDLVQSFRAVAEFGSLSAAARELSITQPTVGRHIDALEETLHVSLFSRGREGMTLTKRGQDLVSSAKQMEDAAQSFSRKAAGHEEDASGTVRITANDVFGIWIMPKLIARFMDLNKNVQVELEVTNKISNLLRRDADIAIRLTRPLQGDLVARKVAELPMGLFAHERYLEKFGAPQNAHDLKQHYIIGYDREPILMDAAKALGVDLSPKDFCFRSDSILAQIEGLKAGIGIGATHVGLAQKIPELVQVLPEMQLPNLELWVTCHSDVRYNMRVRLMMDFLAENLKCPYQWCCW